MINAYYRTTEPLISDEEYDALRKELQRWDPNNPYFDDVGASVVDGEKYTHTEHYALNLQDLER